MTNNKSKIVEDLVMGPEVVTGIKAFQKKRVDEGEAAVVTLDGKYRETLPPGPIYLAKFPVLTQCKMYFVKTRDRQLTVSTTGELTIQQPAPVLVDLSTVVSYRVVDPRIVALEVDKPLSTLFDFTLDAMRHAVQRMQFDEFLVGGQAANWILQALRARGLREYLGLEIINVSTSHIGANERVRQLMTDESLRQREVDVELGEQAARHQAALQQQLDEAYNQRDVSKLIDLTPEYLALYNPELFATVFGNRQATDELKLQALVEMAKMGVISPSALSGGGQDLTQVLLGMLGGQSGQSVAIGPGQAPGDNSMLGLSSGARESAAQRLKDEYAALESAGYNVVFNQLGSGEYAIAVVLQDEEGHTLTIYLVCTNQYPVQPPQVFVELDGQEEQYQSALVRNWSLEHTTVDVVGEVMRYYS
jgi:regulator of protease activity HflC (stomatin/prohibitin superfamily)